MAPRSKNQAVAREAARAARAMPKDTAGRPSPRSRYGGGQGVTNPNATSSFIFGWNPALREPLFDTREGWVGAASRAIDSIQNSGILAGAVEAAVGQMIGSGLSLNAKPDIAIFGGNEPSAESWSQTVERQFTAWGSDPWCCDLGARYDINQLQDQAVRQYFATGEIVGTLPSLRRAGNSIGLKINVMPSMRLVQSTIMGGPYNQIQGVILSQNHEPTAYVFWNAALFFGTLKQEIVAARTAYGRPAVFHIFNNDPGAVRGITPFAPVLKVIRQYDQLCDATLHAALLQTIFAATVESGAPTADIMKAFQGIDEQDVDGAQAGDFDVLMNQRYEWYKQTKIDLGNFGKIAHMFPGESLKFNGSETPNENYEAFSKSLLREIARCLCISYEATSNDYTHATYSSVRQASADLWQTNLKRRAFFPARMMQTIYRCWLEESIDAGLVPFPGGIDAFRANIPGACNAQWRGPAKPIADSLKEAKAMQIARAERWVSRDQLCSEWSGEDWREVARSCAAEKAEDDRLGLDPLPVVGGGGTSAGVQESDSASGDSRGSNDGAN